MDTIEVSAKTVEAAIAEALSKFGCTKDDVEIEILEEPTKGFLGLGSKPARVSVTKRFDPVVVARNFVRELTVSMNLAVSATVELKDKHMYIDLVGESIGVLIGKRGQTLDSLQYLVNLVVNKGDQPYISVTLDAENYRQRRKDTLESLAHNLAKKVKATKKSVVLEPMNPYERRIIHSCLQGDKQITTYSEGDEPFRNVVISYKR